MDSPATLAQAREALMRALAEATPEQTRDIADILRLGAGDLGLPPGAQFTEPGNLPADRRGAWWALVETLDVPAEATYEDVRAGQWETVLRSLVIAGEWEKIAETATDLREQDEEGIALQPTGQRAVRFRGRLLAEASSEVRGGRDSTRHHELALYRTTGGAHVLAITYCTRWQGEQDWTWVHDSSTPADLAAVLEGDPPLPGRVGYPVRSDGERRGQPDPYAERQARMLQDLARRWHVAAREILDALGVERRIE